MPIRSDHSGYFNAGSVSGVHVSSGVYALIEGGSTIYYGMSESNVAARLRTHLHESCTKSAERFVVEVTSTPRAREKELLQEFLDRTGGLPRCNDQI